MGNTVGSLTKLERQIIVGSLLGDGYMRIIPARSDAFLEINHSIKAKEYVDYKFDSLKRLCKSAPKERVTNEGRIAYRFFTRQYKVLTDLHNQFYRYGKKKIPIDLVIDPVLLSVLYMDDGSRSRDRDVYLNTQQFSIADQKKLLYCLRSLDIRARMNKDKQYFRIRIMKESIATFMKIIAPYVIDSMKYKLVITP